MLQWLATEMRTGKVLVDLPDLADQDGGDLTIAVQMGDYQTLTACLPLPTAPEGWQRATLQGASTLVLLQDDLPIWGAYITQSTPDETDQLPLSMVTMEGYFDRVYVGDETITGMGQNDLVVYLVNKYAKDGALAGIPIRAQIVSGGSGTLRDRTYLNTDNKTLYSILQDLAGVDGGPEWTIGWEHLTNPERYTPVVYVGDRLGSAATAGLSPNATFEMPGPVTTFKLPSDYSSGNGANSVMAYSSGQGTAQPVSAVQTFADPTRPRFEYRWTPSTSITNVATLTAYAAGKLALIKNGTKSFSFSAVTDNAPVLGVDWVLGDDIGYAIGGLDQNGVDTVPSVPGGITGVARAIGWTLTIGNTPIITPILLGSSS